MVTVRVEGASIRPLLADNSQFRKHRCKSGFRICSGMSCNSSLVEGESLRLNRLRTRSARGVRACFFPHWKLGGTAVTLWKLESPRVCVNIAVCVALAHRSSTVGSAAALRI